MLTDCLDMGIAGDWDVKPQNKQSKNKTHAQAKQTGSRKRVLEKRNQGWISEITWLYVNNLVGDVKTNPRDFYQLINGKKDAKERSDVGYWKHGIIQQSIHGCVQ